MYSQHPDRCKHPRLVRDDSTAFPIYVCQSCGGRYDREDLEIIWVGAQG